jgi:hypothetical protein
MRQNLWLHVMGWLIWLSAIIFIFAQAQQKHWYNLEGWLRP